MGNGDAVIHWVEAGFKRPMQFSTHVAGTLDDRWGVFLLDGNFRSAVLVNPNRMCAVCRTLSLLRQSLSTHRKLRVTSESGNPEENQSTESRCDLPRINQSLPRWHLSPLPTTLRRRATRRQ